jgi:predicted permease
MDIFSAVGPLGLFILIGFICGRVFHVDIKSIATLLIYIFAPIVTLGATMQLAFDPTLILLPLFVFGIALCVGLSSMNVARLFMKGRDEPYLLPVATGSCNSGYFGLPFIAAFFDAPTVGIYLLLNTGIAVYDMTVGYYWVARGRLSAWDALRRVLGLPLIYAAALGLGLAAFHVETPDVVIKLWEIAKGAFVALGMLLVGFSLSRVVEWHCDARMLALTLCGKFLAWPLLAALLILLDQRVMHLYSPVVHALFFLISLMPLPTSINAYAVQFDLHPQMAVLLTMVSVIIAMLILGVVLPLLVHGMPFLL